MKKYRLKIQWIYSGFRVHEGTKTGITEELFDSKSDTTAEISAHSRVATLRQVRARTSFEVLRLEQIDENGNVVKTIIPAPRESVKPMMFITRHGSFW